MKPLIITPSAQPATRHGLAGIVQKRLVGLLLLGLVSTAVPPASAADYYVDPATGNMSNDGSAAAPWSTLEAVFTANKTFASGDVIYLRSGYHGKPVIKGIIASGEVTIQPDTGATPQLARLTFDAAKRWTISNLDISAQNESTSLYFPSGSLIYIDSDSDFITVQHCVIRPVKSISGWTFDDWMTRLGSGGTAPEYTGWVPSYAITSYAPHTSIIDNTIENVGNAIILGKTIQANTGTVTAHAQYSTIAGNIITAFAGDAVRVLSDDVLVEDNLIQDAYTEQDSATGYHADCIQSWSLGIDPLTGSSRAGYGDVWRMTIRNNILIGRSSANQPHPSNPQGIALNDGMYRDFVIENNIVYTDMGIGIQIAGAVNCRIDNNTVVRTPPSAQPTNPEIPLNGGNTKVLIRHHKKLEQGADPATYPTNIVLSSGNYIRNNVAPYGAVFTDVSNLGSGATLLNNIDIRDTGGYGALFRNYDAFDVAPLAGSDLIDAGITGSGVPTVDILLRARVGNPDVGAIEFVSLIAEPFDYAATNNVSTAADSASDSGWTGTTWSSTNDIVTPGLSHSDVSVSGNALQFKSNAPTVRSVDMAVAPAAWINVDSDGITRIGKADAVVWLSFLFRADVADNGSGNAAVSLLGASSGGATKLRVGDVGTPSTWSLLSGAISGSSPSTIITGETVRLVLRIKFIAGTNNDEVDLFVNPASGSAPTTPSATLRNLDVGTFDRIEAKGNRMSTVDEVRLADDWSGL